MDQRGERAQGSAFALASDSDAQFGRLTRFARNLAAQDFLIGGYLTLLLFAVVTASGPGRVASIETVVVDLFFFGVGLVLTRGGVLRPGSFANSLVYRATVFLPVFLSYFQLRWILPAVSPHSVDAQLFALDMSVFGFEPSLSWDRFVTPQTTEWFAFFYFGYFFVLSAHVFPIALAGTSRVRVAHFALGLCMVFCTGHLLYMLVPGWGPYHHLAPRFTHPLEGGLFWRLVTATVDAGGAQKDIFPSLHTAAPTYIAIYSYIHRRAAFYRLTWPFMAFASTQIIAATMFLRWHYFIDILAGITLATTAALVSHRIVTWETSRRRAAGVEPAFSILDWRGVLGRGGEDSESR
jgi:hypothetical protein